MIAAASTSSPGAGSTAGFPTPPQGSPGEIAAIARSLQDAATQLEHADSSLQAAASAMAADWQGYAANAYMNASTGLVSVARAGAATFRECASAVAGYSRILETTQSEMARLRGLYDEAKARQAAAASTAQGLVSGLAAATKPAQIHQLQTDITRAGGAETTAGDEASGYVSRANQLLEEFHQAETRYAQVLRGEIMVAGHSLPAGSPLAPPTGPGIAGVGFGVPFSSVTGGIVPGALSAYDGTVPVGDPWNSDIPGYGVYMDATTPEAEPTDDLTTAVTFLAAPVAGKPLEALMSTGGRALAESLGIGAAGRAAAERTGQDAFQQAVTSGDYTTGQAFNRAKLEDAWRSRRAANVQMQVDQSTVRGEVYKRAIQLAATKTHAPPGLQEMLSHAIDVRAWLPTGARSALNAARSLFGR